MLKYIKQKKAEQKLEESKQSVLFKGYNLTKDQENKKFCMHIYFPIKH